ncbi:MAG: ATP-dependent DNA helicase RecG [candidate division WOR-3 bacterium]|nr:ATP-dependent DNA helicase RecG [candidate division WOR-3 bacterium]MCX7947918.1 ATP-dependent DNA helicase RecG [candidate division WOR-3 bacterium]MDW8150862.1 ATP-dependent DNA helicase RecG [candidate division WOR-3 bacterium]
MDLNTEIRFLKGIGETRAKRLNKIRIRTIKDLLYHLPRKYLDRRNIVKLSSAVIGKDIITKGEVVSKGTVEDENIVVLKSDGEFLELVWKKMPYILSYFNRGDIVIAAGKVYKFRGSYRILFPEFEILGINENSSMKGIIPVYPLTERINNDFIRKTVSFILDNYKKEILEQLDILPEDIKKARNIKDKFTILDIVHRPNEIESAIEMRDALVYEEMLIFFLNLFLSMPYKELFSPKFEKKGTLVNKLLERLPFKLTPSQMKVISEIEEDLNKNTPMHRLLQGDVGSGKTIVALYTSLIAIENKYQVAIMAPTEILAEQLYNVINYYTFGLGIRVELLVSDIKPSKKHTILKDLAEGNIDLIVGTHSLIVEDVKFKKLGLVIIDEQHRFGVNQRALLLKKSKSWTPHFLVMTATPIPRTLALTIYGDLDVSIIDQKPFNTKIINRWVFDEKREIVYNWLFNEVLNKNKQAYVVVPIIEHSEKLEVKALEEIYEYLEKIKPKEVLIGIVHGRMNREERQKNMENFRNNKFHILLATSVIEVGIDIPNATIMIIEHAERFGISQLHQLRGRIVRSEKTAYCVFITPRKVSEDAKKRLEALVSITDGFKLSEVDLEIRGPGDLLGTKQHGLLEFKFTNILNNRHKKIISLARMDAIELLKKDPKLRNYPKLLKAIENYKKELDIVVG